MDEFDRDAESGRPDVQSLASIAVQNHAHTSGAHIRAVAGHKHELDTHSCWTLIFEIYFYSDTTQKPFENEETKEKRGHDCAADLEDNLQAFDSICIMSTLINTRVPTRGQGSAQNGRVRSSSSLPRGNPFLREGIFFFFFLNENG